MAEPAKKENKTYLELGKVNVKLDGLQRKLIEMGTALNDVELTIKKVMEGYDAKINELIEINKDVVALNSQILDNNNKIADLASNILTVKPQVKQEPQTPQVLTLTKEQEEQLNFGDNRVAPKKYLGKPVFDKIHTVMKSRGYRWDSGDRAWRK